MKKEIFIACFYLLQTTFSIAQTDLISNGSFETSTCCPTQGDEISTPPYCISPWFNANPGSCSPDYFNACSSFPPVQTPSNACGYQMPKTGNAYAGVFLYTGGNVTGSEYIEAKLNDTLVAGRKYYVTFYVSLCVTSKYAVDGIGAYFSNDTLLSDTSCYFPVQPQIENPAGNVIMDTANWVPVFGSFTAAGGELFITIGNFRSFSNTTFDTTSWGLDSRSYYLIDDVSVIDSSEVGINELQNGNLNVNIYPNPSNGNFIIKSKKIKFVELYDLLGEEIYSKITSNYQTNIDISDKPKGVYFLKLKTERGTAVRKVVIQ